MKGPVRRQVRVRRAGGMRRERVGVDPTAATTMRYTPGYTDRPAIIHSGSSKAMRMRQPEAIGIHLGI